MTGGILPPLSDEEKEAIREKLTKYSYITWRPSSVKFIVGIIESVRRGEMSLDLPICNGCKMSVRYLLSTNKLTKYVEGEVETKEIKKGGTGVTP